MQNFINKEYVYAVVGASHNPEKYGNKVYKDLLDAGYNVYPVNPKGGELYGNEVFTSLELLPERPDVVDFVIPPDLVLEILPIVKKLGIKKVWLQPGSESDDAIRFCEENGIECIYGACIMVERHID
jgi:predicted CoA-binding protein